MRKKIIENYKKKYFAPSLRCCLLLLLKFIWRKTIFISNRNYEFFNFEYTASFYDIQVNLKTPKHQILAFNLSWWTKILVIDTFVSVFSSWAEIKLKYFICNVVLNNPIDGLRSIKHLYQFQKSQEVIGMIHILTVFRHF
jgi:hypothetical protein